MSAWKLPLVACVVTYLGMAALLVPVTANVPVEPSIYSPWDDASWAVTTKNPSSLLGGHIPELYRKFMEGCGKDVESNSSDTHCQDQEDYRLKMNTDQPKSVYNFTKTGFKKIKAPQELYDLIYEFYTTNRDKAEIESKEISTYQNTWDTSPSMIILNEERHGGSSHLQSQIWYMARTVLEEWTGQMLSPVSLYGVRLYHNNSILAPHVERMPLVTSAISKFVPENPSALV